MIKIKRPLLAAILVSTSLGASAVTLELVDPKGAVTAFGWSVSGTTIEVQTSWSQQADAFIRFTGLTSRTNFVLQHAMTNLSDRAFMRVALELLDPLGPGNDAAYDAIYDLPARPGFVPAGYSTSNSTDGLSFAKPGGPFAAVPRSSTVFTTIETDDSATSLRDYLDFRGGQIAAHGGVDSLMTFGLRDNSRPGDDQYNEPFLLAIRPNATTVGQVPEPATWALALAGLVGLVTWRARALRR